MRQLRISKQITDRSSTSMEKYLNEVSAIPLLTPEQEIELTTLIHETGDKKAKDKLVKANLRFAISVAKQYQNYGVPLQDLITSANMGLITAADRFDPTRGFKFISFAVWWVRQSILQELNKNSKMVYQPQNRTASRNKITKAIRALEQKLEREPTPAEIAEYTGQEEYQVKDLLLTEAPTQSYDGAISNDGKKASFVTIIEDPYSMQPDSRAIHAETQSEVFNSLAKVLTDRQLFVITSYYGITGTQMSLVQIADELEISTERARQVLHKSMAKVKQHKKLFKDLFYDL